MIMNFLNKYYYGDIPEGTSSTGTPETVSREAPLALMGSFYSQ